MELFGFDLNQPFYGNTPGDYFIVTLVILASVILGKILYYLFKTYGRKLTAKTKTHFDDIFIDIVEEPLVLVFIIVGLWVGISRLTLDPATAQTFNNILQILVILNFAWFLIRFVDVMINEYIAPITAKSKSKLDDQLVPIVSRSSKFVIIILAFIVILSNFGYDITAIVASLGIGGIAVALAAKDILENMFGGLSIFMDRPFELGDRVKIENTVGTVLEVGLRSTRLLTLDGKYVTIPNSLIARNQVESYSKPDHMIAVTGTVGVTYDTSPKKLAQAKKLILESIKESEGVSPKKDPWAYFTEFADSSLNIMFKYWVTDFTKKLEVQDAVNMRIKEKFEKAKIEFAFPTQTIYLER
jgi:MscS family membrane protein